VGSQGQVRDVAGSQKGGPICGYLGLR
jgi:hypothetical protein